MIRPKIVCKNLGRRRRNIVKRKLLIGLIVLALLAVPVFAAACEDEVIDGEE